MQNIDITNEQINRLKRLPDERAVVMVNLVKFHQKSNDGDGSGADAYERYSRGVINLIKVRGGTILWAGKAEGVALGSEISGDWDFIVLVNYPNRNAFVDMMTSDEYAEVNQHRVNGVEKHTILVAETTFSRFAENGI